MFSRRATSLIASVARQSSRTSAQACRAQSRRAFSLTRAAFEDPLPSSATPQANSNGPTTRSLSEGLQDPLPDVSDVDESTDWTRSFSGLSSTAFTDEQAATLQQELDPYDVEVKPDGIVYLPEIKYRRILNKAFKPGGWGLAPRGETIITQKLVTREYALVAGGRLISIARGEQQYFDPDGIPTATEGCKSNALMRCCKDLGIASELWDPRYIRKFLAEHAREALVEHAVTKKRKKYWLRKDDSIKYPFKEISSNEVVRPSSSFVRKQ